MATKNQRAEYYCVAVQRNYEETWRIVSKHATREDAEAEIEKLRSYTGAFNYDNAQLRIISRSEGKKEFGKSWEYVPIGGVRKKVPRGELEEE